MALLDNKVLSVVALICSPGCLSVHQPAASLTLMPSPWIKQLSSCGRLLDSVSLHSTDELDLKILYSFEFPTKLQLDVFLMSFVT